jgi:hypothetical protein
MLAAQTGFSNLSHLYFPISVTPKYFGGVIVGVMKAELYFQHLVGPRKTDQDILQTLPGDFRSGARPRPRAGGGGIPRRPPLNFTCGADWGSAVRSAVALCVGKNLKMISHHIE